MSKKTKKNNEEELSQDFLFDSIDSILNHKDNREFHFNGIDEAVETPISSGSLTLDIEMEGGLRPGIHRFIGPRESGKTSGILEFCRSFLAKEEKGLVIYFDAEGRAGKKADKFGFKDEKRFKVIKSNISEFVFGLIQTTVAQNKELGHKLFFVIDSMDALVRKDDLVKTYEEGAMGARGALLTSDFLRKNGLLFNSSGYYLLLVSQERTEVKINKYEKTPPKQGNSSGGNALQHYANWAFWFKAYSKADWIEDSKGDKIGHYCNIQFEKTDNEKTHKQIKYPVKYGVVGQSAVWLAREVMSSLIAFDHIKKKGAWFSPNEDSSLIKEARLQFDSKKEESESDDELAIDPFKIPENFQGENGFMAFLEDNPEICKFFYEKIKKAIM